ncbi:MAG: alpha/beta fold hydrolase [Deltaproteobacteria bacterium]|nr:alpha/beta fold hydrolase [Deltaproteobacteria bacterium]
MQPSTKGVELETGEIAGIPILSGYSSDEGIGSRPLVILSHAFQSSKEFWQDKMVSLARAGYYTVALDNRGHGERKGPDFKSQVLEKDGFNLYEVRRLIKETADDIPTLIDHFSSHQSVDAARIGMVGVSMGGFIAFRALVIDDRIGVAAPVIASPYFDEKPGDVPLVNRPEINRALDVYSQKFSPAYHPDQFYPRAILIQVGGQDKHLDAGRVRQFYESLKSKYHQKPEKLKFIQEENTGHQFTASMWRHATKWLEKNLYPL